MKALSLKLNQYLVKHAPHPQSDPWRRLNTFLGEYCTLLNGQKNVMCAKLFKTFFYLSVGQNIILESLFSNDDDYIESAKPNSSLGVKCGN